KHFRHAARLAPSIEKQGVNKLVAQRGSLTSADRRWSRTHDATHTRALGALARRRVPEVAQRSRAVTKAVSRNSDIGRSLVGKRGKNPALVISRNGKAAGRLKVSCTCR